MGKCWSKYLCFCEKYAGASRPSCFYIPPPRSPYCVPGGKLKISKPTYWQKLQDEYPRSIFYVCGDFNKPDPEIFFYDENCLLDFFDHVCELQFIEEEKPINRNTVGFYASNAPFTCYLTFSKLQRYQFVVYFSLFLESLYWTTFTIIYGYGDLRNVNLNIVFDRHVLHTQLLEYVSDMLLAVNLSMESFSE